MSSLRTPRPDNNFEGIASQLREAIVRGDLSPGARLPTWDHMAKQYAVARPTLMRAMDRLKRDGFVYARSTRGTYVTERPPHLSRFGLVFASHPYHAANKGDWNRFWDTLAQQAPVIERRLDVHLPVFYDVTSPNSTDYPKLVEQINSSRFAGLILVGRPDLMSLPLFQQTDTPRVAIYGGSEGPDIPRVFIDHDSFIQQSLNLVQERGGNAVAVISNHTSRWDGFANAIQERGLQFKPFWQLEAVNRSITPLVRLLFDPDNARIPDSLIIADDNMVKQALTGIMQSGLTIGEDVRVVTHCNWPWPVPSAMPVDHLGYDANEFLQRCIETIMRLRRGEDTPPFQSVPAITESEHLARRNADEPVGL